MKRQDCSNIYKWQIEYGIFHCFSPFFKNSADSVSGSVGPHCFNNNCGKNVLIVYLGFEFD